MENRLREARKISGLTQKEVGACLGVTPSIIARYESGLNDPSSGKLAGLAQIYGVTTDYLLGRTDSPLPGGPFNLPSWIERLSPEMQAFLHREAAAGWPRIRLLYNAELGGLTPEQIEQVLILLVEVKGEERKADADRGSQPDVASSSADHKQLTSH